MARLVASQQVEHEFVWVPEWIPTHLNVLPDALSRLGNPKYEKIFRDECAQLGFTPKRIELIPEYFDFHNYLGS